MIKTVYGKCQPLQICKGPDDTLLLLDKYNLVLKLEWLNDKGDLRRKSTKAISIHGLTINAMVYVESLDLLVLHSQVSKVYNSLLSGQRFSSVGIKGGKFWV